MPDAEPLSALFDHAPPRVVEVLVPVALDRAYSYRAPDGLDLAPETW